MTNAANPQILNALGMQALRSGDPASARDQFIKAAEADPHEPALWLNVATACRALGDDDGEKAALGHALAINQLNLTAHLRLAQLHERRGDGIPAAQHWSAVVQMAQGLPERTPGVEDAMARGIAFLSAHKADVAQAVDAAVGARLSALGDDGRRFRACMDGALKGRRFYANDCAGLHFPFLPPDEFFERRHFPWLSEIEARTDAIRAEALALMTRGTDQIRPYVRQDKGTPENKWTDLDHSLDWSACFLWEYGERNDAVCAACPETAAALELLPRNHIPGKAPSAFFSILKPGAHIPPHTGVTNSRAIVHLPLVVPPDCGFRVGGETRPWVEGQAFAFDDTIEHEAWNRSSEPRVILIFDVWNPHLTEAEQALLVSFYEVTGSQPKEGG